MQMNRIFSGKLDGFIGTGYGYSGICFFWKTKVGWFYRDKKWMQMNRIFSGKLYGFIETGYGYSGICFFSGKLKLDDFIETRNGCKGIGFFLENQNWMVL